MIYFHNPGEIDIDAAMLLGVNAKDGDSPIGFFGTGLKFAVATLLRSGHDITIYRGTEPYRFSTQEIETRGKQFEAVCMNGRQLGFTTALGRNWQVWQAFRELYSNATDENGKIGEGRHFPSPGTTTIEVQGYEIARVWSERHKYILESSVLEEDNTISVHPGSGIYCRNILVLPCKSTFAYNFKKAVELTEERMLADSYSSRYRIVFSLASMPKSFKRILADNEAPEFDWPWPTNPTMSPETVAMLRSRPYDTLPNSLKPIFSAKSPSKDSGKWKQLLPSQETAVEKAKKLLEVLGIEVTAPIYRLFPPAGETLGMACDGKIALSPRIFAESTPRIASTLLEEHIHVAMGISDNTRSMQDVLLELAVKGAEIALAAQ